MRKIKYILTAVLILVCILFTAEMEASKINHGLGQYYTGVPFLVDWNDKFVINRAEEIADECNIGLVITGGELNSFVSREVNYACTEGMESVVRKKLGIRGDSVKSLINISTDVNFCDFSDESYIGTYGQCYMIGDEKGISDFCKKFEKYYQPAPAEKVINVDGVYVVILIIVWAFAIAMIGFLTYYNVSVRLKEVFVKISFGSSPVKIYLANVFTDVAFSAVIFVVGTLVFSKISSALSNIPALIIAFVVLSMVYAVSYIRYLKFDYKFALSGTFNEKSVLAQSYVLKIISIVISTIVVTGTVVSFSLSSDMISSKKAVENFKDYSYLSYQNHDNIVDNSLINKLASQEDIVNESLYREYFYDFEPVMLFNDYNCPDIIYSNVYAYEYLASEISELNNTELTEDIYILLPQEKYEETGMYVNQAEMMIQSIEGENFVYSCDVIYYDGNENIMCFNGENWGSGVESVKNPCIIYNTIDPTTLTTFYTESGKASIKTKMVYKLTDEDIDAISEKYGFIDAYATNVSEMFETHWKPIRHALVVFAMISLFMIITEIAIISVIVKMEYTISSTELALQKVYGYTIFEKNARMIKLMIVSTVVSMVLSVIAFVFIYDRMFSESVSIIFPVGVSVLFMVIELIVLFVRIISLENKNVQKILKGGAL
ncbi:MAG: hypothetical protein IJP18_04455 [Oscillospiraceae bacterium]|nr:hypothetical protein [Oscillospiraceae bacterium]